MKRVVIYHKDCQDGFASAWVFYRRAVERGELNDTIFVPGEYGKPLPDCVDDAIVYLVDFSYKKFTMLQLLERAGRVFLLDHHKTALDELIYSDDPILNSRFNCQNCTIEKSGALIAWNYCFPKKPVPAMIDMISDRDLWHFYHPDTKAFSAYLFTEPYTFEAWDKVYEDSMDLVLYERMLAAGEALIKKQAVNVKLHLPHMHMLRIGDVIMPAINAMYMYASDVGDALKKDCSGSASYFVKADRTVQFSLRSRDDGLDVSAIAAKYGGGGHKNAAGFTVSFHTFVTMLESAITPEDTEDGT